MWILSYSFIPEQPNQLSLGRKHKDKPLLPSNRFAEINLKLTIKATAELHGKVCRLQHVLQEMPQATNTAVFSSRDDPIVLIRNAKPPGSCGTSSGGTEMINQIVIATGCLVKVQCLWTNELLNVKFEVWGVFIKSHLSLSNLHASKEI